MSFHIDERGSELWGESVLADARGARKGQEGWPRRQVRGSARRARVRDARRGPSHVFEIAISTAQANGGLKAVMKRGGKASSDGLHHGHEPGGCAPPAASGKRTHRG